MTRAAWCVLLFFASAVAGGCATSGNVPGPRPFPTSTSTVEKPAATPEPIATALALRGTPYLNGGSEPARGFDCSGFVQWVFAQHGAALPRETRAQYDEGRRIDRDEVLPGDLVFFETVSRGPSHVGIALGSGQFVHAPSSRGVVRVENLSEWLLVVALGRQPDGSRISGLLDAGPTYPLIASEARRSDGAARTKSRARLRRRRHAGSSVVALSARPPMLSPMTTMSHSGRL